MNDTKNISFLPGTGLSYDPTEAKYWDPALLGQEISRTFEICHSCRMCFKYCDAFPTLFDFLDTRHDGNVRQITADDTKNVMDQCFQCKLCEVQCPYTPRDGHEFQLDFPKLVHRYTAVHALKKRKTLRDRILGNPDGAAKLARMSFGLANVANKMSVSRFFMEKTVGIHRDKLLPNFAQTTFEKWAEKNGKIQSNPGAEAVLFQTCFVQNNEPDIGVDTLEVMEHNGVDVACANDLVCCGMPAWEQGDYEHLKKNALKNIASLLPYVEQGAKVLAINPTCSMMLRREYPELLDGEDKKRAEKLAAAVMDPSEFLWSIRDQERFKTDFKSSPGEKIAYHVPCHLRAQAVGFKGRDLMKKIPNVKMSTTMECCGHNGTYAMKVEGFDPAKRIGKKAFDGLQSAEADLWSTDCPLAAIQFQQHAGRKPLHPMSVLARAYRADGFPNKID